MRRYSHKHIFCAVIAAVLFTMGVGIVMAGQPTLLQYHDKLTGDAMDPEHFGIRTAVATSEDWLAIGATFAIVEGVPTGKLYVFRKNASGLWQLHQRIEPPVVQNLAGFGVVSVDGETMIVGAPSIDLPDEESISHGEAYFYELDPETGQWVLTQQLQASDPTPVARFGSWVLLEGSTAFITATGAGTPDGNDDGGAVYIFERDEDIGEWRETQKLRADGSSHMGELAFDGRYLVVADVTRRPDGVNAAGGVYIFERDNDGIFHHVTTLEPSDPTERSAFGRSVSIRNGELLVGERDGVTNGFPAGAAWLYRLQEDGTWAPMQRLAPPFLDDPDFNPHHASGGFGSWVLLDGDQLYVGASQYLFARDPDESGGSDASANGVVYVYARPLETGLFVLQQTIAPPDPGVVRLSDFGSRIHVHESQVLISAQSARMRSPPQGGAGAVYVLEPSTLDPIDLVTRAEAIPPVVTAGKETTYIIQVSNKSPDNTATGVTLYNPIQHRRSPDRDVDAMEFVSASDGCVLDEDEIVICDLGTLPPGATAEVSLALRVNFGFGGRMTHFATALAREPDVNTVNNTVARAVEVLPPEEPEPPPPPRSRGGGGCVMVDTGRPLWQPRDPLLPSLLLLALAGLRYQSQRRTRAE